MKNNNQIKVLLINPPGEFKTPILPLGLASIAAYLQNHQIENISVIDAWAEKWSGEMGFKKLENSVSQSQADIIGIYMASPRYDRTKYTIEICRKALPNSLIIAGGPHPSAIPIDTLKEIPQLDICVIGEGEITMYELIKAYQESSSFSEVAGMAFKDKNSGEIIITKPRDFIKDLDSLPLPARDLFPLDKYITPPWVRKTPCLPMIASRGCPFQCAYCSKDVFKDTYRARSPQKVCDEIENLISKYGAKEIQFHDDDFTLNMERAEEICDEILKRGIKIYWSCLTRVNLINEQLLRKMKKAGCWLIIYGVESGNQKILDAINKGVTIEQTISAFEMTRRVGIAPLAAFMVGLPGETKETIQDTLNLVKKIKPIFIGCGVLIVYPGSRFYKLIQQGKYQGRLRTLDKKESLSGTFYIKGNYTVFEDNFTFEELREITKKATRQFYLRPQYILERLADIRSFSDIKYYLNGALVVIKSLIR